MLISIDFNSDEAFYVQLRNQIIESQTVLRLYGLIIEESCSCHSRMQNNTIEILGKQQIRTLPDM